MSEFAQRHTARKIIMNGGSLQKLIRSMMSRSVAKSTASELETHERGPFSGGLPLAPIFILQQDHRAG